MPSVPLAGRGGVAPPTADLESAMILTSPTTRGPEYGNRTRSSTLGRSRATGTPIPVDRPTRIARASPRWKRGTLLLSYGRMMEAGRFALPSERSLNQDATRLGRVRGQSSLSRSELRRFSVLPAHAVQENLRHNDPFRDTSRQPCVMVRRASSLIFTS